MNISRRNRTVSLGSEPGRPESPFVQEKYGHKRPPGPTPPRAGSEDSEGPANGTAYGSRFGWTFPKSQNLPPIEFDDSAHEYMPSPPGSRPSSRLSAMRPSQIPVRSPRKGDSPSAVSKHSPSQPPRGEPERDLGRRRSTADIAASATSYPPRTVIEPIDLIHAEIEDLVPTDIESGEFLW